VTALLRLAEAPVDLGLLLRATLLMVLAWAGAATLRRSGASAAARHTAWLLCVAALLALPLLRWLVPAMPLPILPSEPALPANFGQAVPAAFVPSVPGATTSMPPGRSDLSEWGFAILAAYALGAVVLLIRLAAGRWLLARLWRDSEPAADEAWEHLLTRLSKEMGLPLRVRLRIAGGPAMPMTWGTLRPRLLLPAEATTWPCEQRRLVLLHELAHVARRDSLSRSAAALACALYWFHPGAWLAARQMRIEQEHAADDRVLAAGGSARAYARSLLHLARGLGDSARPELAATMAGSCQLERRLVSITRPARRDRPGTAFVSSSVALAGLATLIAATGVPVSASSALPEAGATAASLPSTDRGRDSEAIEDRSEAPLPGPARAVGTASAGRSSLSRPVPAAVRTGGGVAPRNAGAERAGEAVSVGQSPTGPYVQPLPDYGWDLRRAGPHVPVVTVPSQPDRLSLPSRSATSDVPAARPRWARHLPQLTRQAASRYPFATTSNGSLMLSLSTSADP
jgi:beta-lactamase regulating signal transducer with metallopeptidase domain